MIARTQLFKRSMPQPNKNGLVEEFFTRPSSSEQATPLWNRNFKLREKRSVAKIRNLRS
jgi:hypothetical protein